jgi:hypothetical protein
MLKLSKQEQMHFIDNFYVGVFSNKAMKFLTRGKAIINFKAFLRHAIFIYKRN